MIKYLERIRRVRRNSKRNQRLIFMKKILITGADGFIGSHLVEALKKYKVKLLFIIMHLIVLVGLIK